MTLIELTDAPLGVARYRLAALPTPLHALSSLRQFLGENSPEIWIKRDDLTGVALGGNKARKLEYLLADARSKWATVVITCGAAQSNHALQTAAVAGRVGFKVVCVLDGPEPDGPPAGNLLLHRYVGTHIVWASLQPGETRREQARRRTMASEAAHLRTLGETPYIIPTGGSVAVGSLGYVQAVGELLEQMASGGIGPFNAVYFASGSGGTQAGIEVGARKYGWSTRLVGVDVDYIAPDSSGTRPFHRAIVNLVRKTADLAGLDRAIRASEIELNSEYAGPAYGVSTAEGEEAMRLLALTEGIFLDPVYSGKAFSALLGEIRAGRYAAQDKVLFWHTGGVAGLFAPH